MPWEISSEKSVYLQLIDIIKQKIMSGEYQPGQRLPSVRELAADAAVNPNTMQRALTELEREGLLYTLRTSGRFVSEDGNMIDGLRMTGAEQRTKEFYLEMIQSGFSSEDVRRLLEKAIEEAEEK
ncbi:MAG: GntR family transcriptional regulator [Lachnospiraceae bacterium]|nr:GntR family transcriptional regulator [Lachnospiraceae bacterium]MBQ8549020.1 GntR family transcriptional regulator [Lachnospiraceae bacterium]